MKLITSCTIILGLLLIILNIFCDLQWIPSADNESSKWFLTILSKFCSTVGLTLLLGNLTRWFNSKDEKQNEEKRKTELFNILKSIVVSKDYISTLSNPEKQQIITTILTPDNSTLNKHSNIQDYLNDKSKLYLDFFNVNFRGNMTVDVEVLQENKRYSAKFKICYRIFKINNEYLPIHLYSEKEHNLTSTIIKTPDNKTITVKTENLKKENDEYILEIPNDYNKYNFLTIERTVTEYGHAHWISINWKSMTPIDGIDFKVHCEQGIIKDYHIFDNPELYDKPNFYNNRKTITIKSSHWLDPYTGICIIVAKDDNDKYIIN